MAQDNVVQFILDLDDTNFVKTVTGSISKIEGLAEAAKAVTLAAGAIGVAFLAVKTAVDLVFQAEQLKSLQNQFELLSKQAGVSGDEIKSAMERASGGLINEAEMLKLVNKGFIDLGSNVSRLPEIMELARKVSMVTGQSVSEAFEEFNHAVISGQTEQLKNMGIVIDAKEAYHAYAVQLGIATNELNQNGKVHAILNEAISQGQQKYKGINVDIIEARNSWDTLKATLFDVAQMATLAYEKIAGPTVRNSLNWLKDWASGAKTWFQANFGSGVDAAAAKTDILRGKIQDLKVAIIDLEQDKIRTKDPFRAAEYQAEIVQLQDQLKKYQAELAKTDQAIQKTGAAKPVLVGPPAPTPQQRNDSEINGAQAQKNQAQFQRDMLAIQQQALQQRSALMTTEAESDRALQDQKVQIHRQTQARIAEINASEALDNAQKAKEIAAVRASENDALQQAESQRLQRSQQFLDQRKALLMSEAEADKAVEDQKVLIHERTMARIAQIDANPGLDSSQRGAAVQSALDDETRSIAQAEIQRSQLRQQSLDNQNRMNQESAQGFATAWRTGSRSASLELSNWNATGKRTFKSFEGNATNALLAFGAGQKSASEAAKGFIFGMLADEAEARVKLMLLASIWPPNPAGLAAGAGLIALAGFLRSQGAGSGSSAGGASAGGGAASGGAIDSGRPEITEKAQTPKAVTLQIMGSYFETEQTKTRLIEMIREASDATDYTITGGR